MFDFKNVADALKLGAPTALYIALIGAAWQLLYAYFRDRHTDKEAKLHRILEQAKFDFQKSIDEKRFEHERALERLKFESEQLKWREQLALELAKHHLDARLIEYPALWALLRAVARHAANTRELSPEKSQAIASEIESWRYSKGGLLAEETTRDAALALQTALWHYDSSQMAFRRIRKARRLVRASLRADMGLGMDDRGQSIFDATAARHRIAQELAPLREQLGLVTGVADEDPDLPAIPDRNNESP